MLIVLYHTLAPLIVLYHTLAPRVSSAAFTCTPSCRFPKRGVGLLVWDLIARWMVCLLQVPSGQFLGRSDLLGVG